MIELLDVKKQWGKLKAGWNSSNRLFRNPPAQPKHPYANGIDPMTEQGRYGMSSAKASVFTGKTFSQRK